MLPSIFLSLFCISFYEESTEKQFVLIMQIYSSYATLSSCQLYFLGIHTSLKASVYTEKIQVTSGIFHGIPQESVA